MFKRLSSAGGRAVASPQGKPLLYDGLSEEEVAAIVALQGGKGDSKMFRVPLGKVLRQSGKLAQKMVKEAQQAEERYYAARDAAQRRQNDVMENLETLRRTLRHQIEESKEPDRVTKVKLTAVKQAYEYGTKTCGSAKDSVAQPLLRTGTEAVKAAQEAATQLEWTCVELERCSSTLRKKVDDNSIHELGILLDRLVASLRSLQLHLGCGIAEKEAVYAKVKKGAEEMITAWEALRQSRAVHELVTKIESQVAKGTLQESDFDGLSLRLAVRSMAAASEKAGSATRETCVQAARLSEVLKEQDDTTLTQLRQIYELSEKVPVPEDKPAAEKEGSRKEEPGPTAGGTKVDKNLKNESLVAGGAKKKTDRTPLDGATDEFSNIEKAALVNEEGFSRFTWAS